MNSRWLVVAVVLIYLVMLFGGGALKPGYSHISQFISELNATGTPYARSIGWLGFVSFGVFAGTLLVVTARKAPVQGISRLGYWLLMAEPIAYIGSAIVPCDIGCPAEGSPSQILHNVLGLFTYLSTALGLFFLSFTPSLSSLQRAVWVCISLLWLTLFGLMVDGSLAQWRGILQRLAEWIVYGVLWTCAWRLLGPDKSSGPNMHGGDKIQT